MILDRVACTSVGAFLALAWTTHAFAYRPFDGTDADVAAPHEIELELGPVGYQREGTDHLLVAPALVFNYGLAPRFEAVLEGRRQLVLGAGRHPQLQDIALSIKSMLREGSLQDGRGVSVALETGLLLPGSERRLGAHVASIMSWRCPALTLHWNLGNDLLTSVHYLASTSLIAEGPNSWVVRPVAEVLLARDFGALKLLDRLERSLLVGAIVSWSDAWSFDVAFRHGAADAIEADEARFGFTWSFAVQ